VVVLEILSLNEPSSFIHWISGGGKPSPTHLNVTLFPSKVRFVSPPDGSRTTAATAIF